MDLLMVDPACTPLGPTDVSRAGSFRQGGEVAILRMNCPAPCAWTGDKQQQFIDLLARLAARADLAGVVIHGDRMFIDRPRPAGGARRDFRAVIEAVADCPIPVVAALGGETSGSE